MFCIVILLGLVCENKGVVVFVGFIGYVVMNFVVNFWLINKGILLIMDVVVLKVNNI